MDTYTEKLEKLLFRVTGKSNVFDVDSKTIDSIEDKSKFDLQKVRGNIHLLAGRFKTPFEVDKDVQKFISEPLP
jgi:hypothetical protein